MTGIRRQRTIVAARKNVGLCRLSTGQIQRVEVVESRRERLGDSRNQNRFGRIRTCITGPEH
jgi:hypothetical protein